MFKAGDKVKLDWRVDSADMAAKTGTIVDHPTNNDWIIVVSDDVNWDWVVVYICLRDGTSLYGDESGITLIDPAREAWDALNSELRSHINWLTREVGQKIRAIKLLRALTGLGLVDGKRAVESGWP